MAKKKEATMKSMEGCGENLRALHKLPSANLNDWKQRCKENQVKTAAQ